ncbi:MAG: type II toxin-antitoxin system VapC family toxin [Verrucomicrobiota bacterium JB022]|nr:type II toxin-antitoxin system VapC family toxin [Verrucomicrobiota bacterium JB022]
MGKQAAQLIRDAGSGEIAISAITLIELVQIAKKGRITLLGREFRGLHRIAETFAIIPIDAHVAIDSIQVPLPHADPFDRIIVATARRHGLTLLTRDSNITDSGCVETVW